MHTEAYNFFETESLRHAPALPYDILEIGGRNINGAIHHLFPCRHYDSIDLVDAPGVTIVANAATWQPTRKYDLVLCAEVFEHTHEWWDMINATAWNALHIDGTLLASCATGDRPPHSAHGGPLQPGEYYENVCPDAMHEALCHWRDVSVTVAPSHGKVAGDMYIRATR